MSDRHIFEVWQDGFAVAKVEAESHDAAFGEAAHYATLYSQDGPAEIFQQIGRKKRLIATYYPNPKEPRE